MHYAHANIAACLADLDGCDDLSAFDAESYPQTVGSPARLPARER